MVKLYVNDFLDLLSNKNVKTKFADMVANSISTKLNDLQATIDSLHLELAAKDAVITRIEPNNQRLTKLVNDLSAQNDDLMQDTKRDNLIISGKAPYAAEAVSAGRNNTSSQASVVKLVDFCHDVLQLAHIKQDDVSVNCFLPQSKPATGRPAKYISPAGGSLC